MILLALNNWAQISLHVHPGPSWDNSFLLVDAYRGIDTLSRERETTLSKLVLLYTTFQKGICVQDTNQEVTKIASIVKNGRKSTLCIKSH